MSRLDLSSLVKDLRGSEQFAQKRSIGAVVGQNDQDSLNPRILNGDDAAAIPDGDGYLLLATEGIVPSLVEFDPFMAGRSAVLANVNDIYSMGGRPVAMVDVIGSKDPKISREILRGMRDFSTRFQVPIVGGHTLTTDGGVSASLTILGRARRLITSFDAHPGDRIALVYNPEGVWLDDLGFWNSIPGRSAQDHVGDLELLPQAAESGLVHAGKDISMAGIAGTVLMFAEASGLGGYLELDSVPIPEGIDPGRWLVAYFSYGFLLAVDENRWGAVSELFEGRSLQMRDVGFFCSGSRVFLSRDGETEILWDWSEEPFTGFSGR